MTSLFSKKIPAALFLGTIIVVGAYFISINKNTFSTNEAEIKTEEFITAKGLVAIDTDLDGIKDWEEGLWGTDPYKKDSDGDGIPDSEEVRLLRQKVEPEVSSPEKTTETDAFSREFFAAAVSLRDSGQLDEETVGNLSRSLIEYLVPTGGSGKYVLGNLRVVIDSEENFSSYKTSIEKLIAKYPPSDLGKELVVVAEALEKDDAQILVGLLPFVEKYLRAAQEGTTIPVPKEVSSVHLSVVNDYAGVALSLKKLSTLFENPIVGVVALNEYRAYADKLTGDLNSIATYIRANAIIFNKK